MEPTTLIISALTAGATTALSETAGTAIKDAYQALIALLKKKFTDDPKAKVALESHAEDPKTWQKPLEKSLKESGAVKDKEIIEISKKIIAIAQTANSTSKYNVKIEGDVQGFVQGDGAKVTMNFNKPERKRKKKK